MKSCTASLARPVHQWRVFPGGRQRRDTQAPPLRLTPPGMLPHVKVFDLVCVNLKILFLQFLNNKEKKNLLHASYQHVQKAHRVMSDVHLTLGKRKLDSAMNCVHFCPCCPIRQSVFGALAVPRRGSSCSACEWWPVTRPLWSDPTGSSSSLRLMSPSLREWSQTGYISFWLGKKNRIENRETVTT